MITAVDTNVLVDIFIGDERFGQSSAALLKRCLSEGAVVICGVALVETMILFPSQEQFLDALSSLSIKPDTISMEAFLSAASIWKSYRANKGKQNRVVADFLIGAHALIQCDRLLTRDRGFYRQYFKSLQVLNPE